jgi:hypothetical protein
VSHVRLLTDGVDVPGIDAIAFIDTRRRHGSIVEAVARAVRPAPGETVGTIILPVVLGKGESFDAASARSEHPRDRGYSWRTTHATSRTSSGSLDDPRFNVGRILMAGPHPHRRPWALLALRLSSVLARRRRRGPVPTHPAGDLSDEF